jgi:protein SCO1/2
MSGTCVDRPLAWLQAFFAGWRFPVFALALLCAYELGMLALLFVPGGDTGLGAFADEFRAWCFGYDPATGRYEIGYLLTMFTSPWIIAAVIGAVWWQQLAALRRRDVPRVAAMALGASGLAWGGVALLTVLGARPAVGELPFPAEELRTTFAAPGFRLVDHAGQEFALDDLRGRVVVVTGVYATCGLTCPMIMAQAKAALAELLPDERSDVTVVGITLDPDHDTPDVLAAMARGQQVEAPLFRLTTGLSADVERTLDAYGIARRRDPETGVIDHANVFVLIDRSGRIAYRLTLGERQQRWLVAALRLLCGEMRA